MNGEAFSRRRFLIGAGAAGAALAGGAAVGHWLDAAPAPAALSRAGTGPLVLITLYGGNDGLNTVVPYVDPAYRQARPNLGYQPDQLLDLGDGLALNGQLKGLHSLWHSGQLAIVLGVGYPNPSLSHFSSMDIWQTANPVDGTGPGWLGRWLDRTGDDPLRAVSLGATLPPVLRGERQAATAITSPLVQLPGNDRLAGAYAALQGAGSDRSPLAAQVATSGSDLLVARGKLDRFAARPAATGQSPPGGQHQGGLAAQMAVVAALINAGASTAVYQVSLSSFDNHADEKANHERLLGEVDAAVTSFLHAVAGHPAGRRAVVMTYSEFGRRPAENASGGTDHGTAAPLFVAGAGVKGGRFYGEQPSLTRLDANGNLHFTLDFRRVYATVLERVVGTDPEAVLGASFPILPVV